MKRTAEALAGDSYPTCRLAPQPKRSNTEQNVPGPILPEPIDEQSFDQQEVTLWMTKTIVTLDLCQSLSFETFSYFW